jgi:hypothetical protein
MQGSVMSTETNAQLVSFSLRYGKKVAAISSDVLVDNTVLTVIQQSYF